MSEENKTSEEEKKSETKNYLAEFETINESFQDDNPE